MCSPAAQRRLFVQTGFLVQSPLTVSQRASAARSTTRLLERDLAAQQKVGGPLTLTAQGRRLLERQGELIARVLTASRSPAASALAS